MTDSSNFLARALDPSVTAPDDPLSERVLDAALELAVESGMRNVTVDDVARRAGVGRVTIYRRFTDRGGLVDALFLRETRRCLTALRRAVDFRLPPEEQVVEGFVAALRIAREHPLMARVVRVERDTVLATVARREVFSLLRDFMSAQLRAGHFDERPAGSLDVEAIAEVVVRLGLSYVLLPEGAVKLDDEGAVRLLARQVIVPLIAVGGR